MTRNGCEINRKGQSCELCEFCWKRKQTVLSIALDRVIIYVVS